MLGNLAFDFDNHLAFDAAGVLRQLARDAPVLREYHQAAGPLFQRRHRLQMHEVALQHADA